VVKLEDVVEEWIVGCQEVLRINYQVSIGKIMIY
jgi:hypothetical protein